MMLRKTTVASEDAIARSKDLYTHIGGVFANAAWRMAGGGRIGFGYLDSIHDADAWQGRNLTDLWIEEVGLYASPDVIWRMFGVLRSEQNALLLGSLLLFALLAALMLGTRRVDWYRVAVRGLPARAT